MTGIFSRTSPSTCVFSRFSFCSTDVRGSIRGRVCWLSSSPILVRHFYARGVLSYTEEPDNNFRFNYLWCIDTRYLKSCTPSSFPPSRNLPSVNSRLFARVELKTTTGPLDICISPIFLPSISNDIQREGREEEKKYKKERRKKDEMKVAFDSDSAPCYLNKRWQSAA